MHADKSIKTEHADIIINSHYKRQNSAYVLKRISLFYMFHDMTFQLVRMQWGDKNNYRFHVTIEHAGIEYFTRCNSMQEVREYVFSVICGIR